MNLKEILNKSLKRECCPLCGEKIIDEDVKYWFTPVGASNNMSAREKLKKLLVDRGEYALGQGTPNKEKMKPGDGIIFYIINKVGVVADAKFSTSVAIDKTRNPTGLGEYPYTCKMREVRFYPDTPIEINSELCKKLDAYEGHLGKSWTWFVRTTRSISKHDFDLLTGR